MLELTNDLEQGLFLKTSDGYLKKSDAMVEAKIARKLNSKAMVEANIARKLKKLSHVGHVGFISFSSLCVFTGLASSTLALQTARQSRPNDSSKNSTFGHMCDEIECPGKTTDQVMSGIWKPLGLKMGECMATIENAGCGIWREKATYDCFFFGQNLYTLYGVGNADQSGVMVKAFGNTEWKPFDE